MIQAGALRLLAYFHDRETAGFAELCKNAGYPTDLGGYYIRQLTSSGYIEKSARGEYKLLPKGKQELAINYGKRVATQRPRLVVILVTKRKQEFLAMTRRVQPFIGTVEWPAGRVEGGEALEVASARIARERLGIEVEPHLRGFFRRIDMWSGSIFDDKLLAVHSCDLPLKIEPAGKTKFGENKLYSQEELLKIAKPSRSLLDILNYSQSSKTSYTEKIYNLSPTDLS
jgi:8-oxo-dGTP pyrophosphatase MutT (NUDIX family)